MEAAYYELVQVLGEGGMGCVYRAYHRPSGLAVAIKTLRAEMRSDAMRRRLLLDEATAAAKLDDRRIVRLLDLGRDEDAAPFLVMELAEGHGLDHWLSGWPGWGVICSAMLDVLEGLASAHAAGIVHCDLKPANVLLDLARGGARILDFGVATQLDPLRDEHNEGVAGTPEFMPPEQLSGSGPIGPWTDLYAFGVMLAYAVRGSSPFSDFESLAALLAYKATYKRGGIPGARQGLEVPRELQELIERLLAPHPRGRPRFAIEVHRALAALSPYVIDAAPRVDPTRSEGPTSVRPTTVDPLNATNLADPGRTLPPRMVTLIAREPSREIVLPARLPAAPVIARGAALARLREIPLVGREGERGEIEALMSVVCTQGGAHLIALVGDAGIGKSRIARWGLAHVERNGTMEGASGGYDPSGADVAGGLRHALRRLVGIPGRAWVDAWSWLENETSLDLALLARFLRADDTLSTLGVDTVAQLSHATLRAVGRLRPIYLWLDDLAWAKDGALQLVERLLAHGDVPVLVVGTMRAATLEHPSSKAALARLFAHPHARMHHVGELATEERAGLLAHVVSLAPGIANALAERIDGSPLLLVQLVHDWLGRGLLEVTPDGHRPARGKSIDDLLVERPLAALVNDRIREVLAEFGEQAAAAEGVLERAALLGARFELTALRAACARNATLSGALDRVLDRALLVGLLRSEPGQVYVFDYGLLHEALVERVELRPDRAAAMLDAANGIQARYGKERADIAALVADLLHRAGDSPRAWERQLQAIERSAWGSDDASALAHLATAREWLAQEPEHAAEVALAEARADYFALRYPQALAAIARARALSRPEDALFALRCDATEADVLFFTDRFAQAERLAAHCAAAAADDPEHALVRTQALQRLGELAALRGDLETALSWRQQTVQASEGTGLAWRTRILRLNVSELLAVMGRFDEARAICAAVAAEGRAERDEDCTPMALDDTARVEVLSGNGLAVRAHLATRAMVLEANGDTWRLTANRAFSALISAENDDDAAVAASVRQFIDAFRAVAHDEMATSTAMRMLALRLEERGLFQLAHEIDALLEARAQRYRAGFARE